MWDVKPTPIPKPPWSTPLQHPLHHLYDKDNTMEKEEMQPAPFRGDTTTRFLTRPRSAVEHDRTRAPTSTKPVRADFGPRVESSCTIDFGNATTPAIPSKSRVKLDNKQPILTTDVQKVKTVQTNIINK